MSDVFKNIRGTTRDVFKIGKNGSNIFVRTSPPTTVEGFDGDWCLINDTIPMILKKMNGEWIDVNASNIIQVTSTTFTYSQQTAHDVLLCDHSAELTLTIDTIPPKGHNIVIKDVSGAASTNNIVINSTNGITIDGITSSSITSDYGNITLLSNGTNLFVI